MAESSLPVDHFCCPVCLELLKDPVTIPCGHSFCKVCINGCWDQEDLKGVYSCPQCRRTFTTRPVVDKNTMLAEVVEKLEKTELHAASPAGPGDVECDFCTGRKLKALKSCLVCLASYCETHLQPHYQSPAFKKHKLVKASRRLQEQICSEHEKLLEVYCRTDQQCICMLCTMEDHKGHDTVSAAAERAEKQDFCKMAESSLPVDHFCCPVCLELLKDPVTIPCGHSFCKVCINGCWDQEDLKGVYSCPQCRRTFTTRPAVDKNTMLAEVDKNTMLTAKQLVEIQKKYQQKIQEREKELQELKNTVEYHQSSAQAALQDTERIFTELICCIERKRSELSELIRDQEKAAVRGAEGVLKRLEQEIAELRRRNTELEQLSLTEDHLHFLQSFQSLSAPPGSAVFPTVTVRPVHSFEEVVKSASQLRDDVEKLCEEEIRNTSLHVKGIQITEPQTREDFLYYSCELTLDPNTVNEYLRLSEGNRVVTDTDTVQPYPDHPDRFEGCLQVLCRESVSGRCYWEVEWSVGGTGWVCIAVSYKNISRKGDGAECVFGRNNQSWCLFFSSSVYLFWHNNKKTVISADPRSCRIGVFVDYRAGTLSFYSISDTMTLLHRVHTTFTHTIYPGFTVYAGSSVKLCSDQ